MSQNDNFAGGFLAGTLVGGVLGGVVGVLLASRLTDEEDTDDALSLSEEQVPSRRRRTFPSQTEQHIESTRQGLEDKIAQLNEAIDEVRQQLSSVSNGNGQALESRSSINHDV